MTNSSLEQGTIAKVSSRIVPFLIAAFFISFLDRVNVGFAALQMNKQLGFTATVFGWGVGAFFLSLCLAEVPANILMARVGPRRWICRIMISWGIVSGATAFVVGIKSFLVLRFLLGLMEAGFFPGVILYLGTWFPRAHRARVLGYFLMAMPLANFIGSPISGAILSLDGHAGLHGWQWLFLLEAAPAVLLGILALFVLPDNPTQVSYLANDQRAWLIAQLAAESQEIPPVHGDSILRGILHPRILGLAVIYAGSVGTNYALSYWQPQMIKAFGLTNLQVGLVNAIPFGIGTIFLFLWARHADRTQERVWHTAIPLMVSVTGLLACLFTNTLWPTLAALTLALAGCYAVKAPLFALSAESLSAKLAPAGIGQVCAIGNIAGALCPTLMGWLHDKTHSFKAGMLPMAALSLAGIIIALSLRSNTTTLHSK